MRFFLATLFLLMGLSSQAATLSNVADRDVSQFAGVLGEPETSPLDAFGFFVGDRVDPETVHFEAFVYAWDSLARHVTSESLYTLAPLSSSNNDGDGFEEIAVTTGGVTLGAGGEDLAFTIQTSVVPIPAAVWLFGSALGFVGWWRPKSTGAPQLA